MNEHVFIVDEGGAGMRLDLYLVQQFPGQSRSQIQKRIKLGLVKINKEQASVHQFLQIGDEIKISEEVKKTETEKKKLATKLPEIHILQETEDWMVIDKPAGLLVHPTEHAIQHPSHVLHPTLVDFLLAHDPAIAKVGEEPSRPGIVHRLDREVSGLMVIAKTQRAFEHLKSQFGQRQVEKRYLALVHGEISKDIGDIKFRIARSTSKPRMAARPEVEEGGKAAWTHYRVIRRFSGATLVELDILSGRTHQIRAHMHAIQHPVIGDPLYVIRRTDRKITPKRILLQSIGLAFFDPITGERQEFTLEPDAEFGKLEQELK